VVFGLSLGDSDSHLTQALADNVNMPVILVGLHGDPKSPVNEAIYASLAKMKARRDQVVKRRRRGKQLEVVYYDSATANAWG